MGKSLKGKELGKGISQRKDGRYIGRFTNRFGKRQTVYGKTQTEIADKMKEAQFLDDRQENVINDKITLDEWFEIWMNTYKKKCRETTLRTYTNQYNAIKKDLGWRQLKKINIVVLQQTFNRLKSDNMRKHCRAILVDMFERAIIAELLIKNPAKYIVTDINNFNPKEKRILSKEEIEILYDATKDRGYMRNIILLSLNTGMRLGEILGLCWDCVDFENNVIRIERTLVYMPKREEGLYGLNPPKTQAGRREIPMTKEVRSMLLKQKMVWNCINALHEPREGFGDLVFTSKTNNPIHEANIKSALNYYIAKIQKQHPDFKPFSMHCLRHTFATNCIEAGMRPKTLQKILGHKSLQMTMDLYTHVRTDTLKEQMQLVSEMA